MNEAQKRLLDRAEQIVVAVIFIFFVRRIWPEQLDFAGLIPITLLVSEGAVVVLLILRRPTTNISVRPQDWLLASGGTFLALMVGSGGDPLSINTSLILILLGTLVQVFSKFSLRRSFGLVAANRGVKKSGMYAFLRHPMYAGYMVSHIGYLMYAPTVRNMFVYAAVWGLLVGRIFAEERMLIQDDAYRDYTQKVRYRLAPFIF
jgi:protein-S-isoprenylcysteine O-methyltransferase Ste14